MKISADLNLPVWFYWEGSYHDWIQACHQTIFDHAPYSRLITSEIFDELWDTDRDIDIAKLCIAHRADFIRAFLLAKFGGLWIDSDCLVIKPLQPIINHLKDYDFMGFKQRQGDISNSFIGAQKGSIIANNFYQRICKILRSGQPIEWLTIGSEALEASIRETGVRWCELDVHLIQPICWSRQEPFFSIQSDEKHTLVFDSRSYCYMLSGSMVMGYIQQTPGANLLNERTFFRFLLKKSVEEKLLSISKKMTHRPNTDDDMWVIPEIIEQDMYKIRELMPQLQTSLPSYVIDCGAHIGAFSLLCALCLKNIEVISFEPVLENFDYLSQNVKNVSNIRPINKAVAIEDGKLMLYAPTQKEWTGRWSINPTSNAPISVDAIHLFDFIKKLDKPVFIVKLDLEGYEETLVNQSTIEDWANIQVLMLETHSENLNHNKLMESGFQLLFQPHISSARQFVYAKNLS